VVKRLCTSPITAQFGVQVAHEVTDEAFAAGRGEYEAVCGVMFVLAPLSAPPGRPCPRASSPQYAKPPHADQAGMAAKSVAA
jgi:hypothetical protein